MIVRVVSIYPEILMSNRYKAIVALLDDPMNMACVIREVLRQQMGQIRLLPPPIPREGGGWVFPTFSRAIKAPLPPILKPDQKVEFEFEIKTDGTRWVILTREGSEIGPFGEKEDALNEAHAFAMSDGFILLKKMPWDNTDVLDFPM
jgi:hypothetical protein